MSRWGKLRIRDIIAHNGEEIVIVEVKTPLRVKQVDTFIARLHWAKHHVPEYRTVQWLVCARSRRATAMRRTRGIRDQGHG